jgi:hypothetical protein
MVVMNKPNEIRLNEIALSLTEFLQSFNQNMPVSFPQVSAEQLVEFKKEHESLFKKSNSWSLDQHRKKVMDWLPRNINIT